MKIFYYPLFFRLRRYGEVPAIVAATLIVFVLTWVLHAYQWFWLRGDFPITWQDGIFWMGLALPVRGQRGARVQARPRALARLDRRELARQDHSAAFARSEFSSRSASCGQSGRAS